MANAFDDDREVCRAAGMDEFASKPVEVQAPCELMLRWLDWSAASPA